MAVGANQPIGYIGTNISFVAASALEGVTPGERVFLWVKNGGGGATTITVVVPGTTFEQPNPDVAVSVSAGQERMIGPLNGGLMDPTSGVVLVGVSVTTSVTLAAVELSSPPPDLP